MESEIELIPLQRALKRLLDFQAEKEKEALPRCQEYSEQSKVSELGETAARLTD